MSINGLTAGKNYELTVTGVAASDGSTLAEDFKQAFTAKEESYVLIMNTGIPDDKNNTLKADGKDSTKFTVSVADESGNIVKDVDKIELQFDTTAGNFANKTVTVQNGVAENIFTSESLIAAKTALITVTIINASNTKLINTVNTANIVLDPNPETTADESAGATLTDIKVQTADRVALFFNKDVNADDYLKPGKDSNGNDIKVIDTNKVDIKIIDKSNSSSKQNYAAYALEPIAGNNKALYAYVSSTMNGSRQELTDNSEITVEFTDKTKALPVKSTKSAILQDITVPALLSVENEGLTKIKLTYSEPVNWKNVTNGAVNIKNYVLDGIALNDDVYGSSTKATLLSTGFNRSKMFDESNIVTITLGKDNAGNQIYLKSGIHSIQASNIGDAANITDVDSNKLITQTLDFTIPADDTLITAEAEVQSPEQYLVKLSRDAADDPLQKLQANMKLQAWDSTASKWIDIAKHDAGIHIRPVIVNGQNSQKEFIVETVIDWTKWYGTSKNYVNYYNSRFRLFVAKDVLTNPANGKKNQDIEMLLSYSGSAMNEPDVTSPTIEDVKALTGADAGKYAISLSEPVQVPDKLEIDVTPNETQGNKDGVPVPTVSFIKSDNSKTVPAEIEAVDSYNKTIIVKPSDADALTPGIWKVVVYHISDDVGNTAATLVKPDFEIAAPQQVVDGFKAIWIVAVRPGQYDPIKGEQRLTNASDDIVYVKYNQNIAVTGSSANVINTANYQVNGYTIPVSTKIDVSINQYNSDVLKVYGLDAYKDTIAIHLTPGTTGALAADSNNVFLAETLASASGAAITNGGLKTLDLRTTSSGNYFAWNYRTDVKTIGDPATNINTITKLKDAISNDDNMEVIASALQQDTDKPNENPAKGKYEIKKAMTVDFANNTAKSLTINTQSSGKIVVKNLKEVETVTVNAPNADVEFTGSFKVTDKLVVNGILKKLTLSANSDIKALDIADIGHDDITVAGSAISAKIETVNNRNSKAVVANLMTIKTWNQTAAGKLELQDITLTDLNVKAAAPLVLSKANTIDNINVAKDVAFASVKIDVALTKVPTIVKNAVFNANNEVTSSETVTEGFKSVTGKADDVVLANDTIKADGSAVTE